MKHWTTKPLGNIVTCLDSQRIPVKEDDRQKRLGSVPYYGANGQVGWIDKAIFDEPLLLVAEDGGHFNEPEKGVAYTISGPAWVNNHAHVLRPDQSKILLNFLGYHFRHFDFSPYITGTTRAKLNQKDLMRVTVPVPPLVDQQRIVKLINEADELRKLREQADHRTDTLIPSLYHQMFVDLQKNTSRFPILPLGEVVEFGSGATPSKENPEFWNGRTPWVSPKDMKVGEITDTEDHVSAAAFKESNLQLIPKDTVLIVVRGMILAHTVPIRLCRVSVAINQDMKALLPKQPIEPDFLRWSLQAKHQHLLNQVSTAGHGTKKLDSDRLREVTIPVPPLPLQKEFAARVSEIRALETEQTVSNRRLDDLFQSMLHRAFSGEL
jgi:type I restriction enzyme, S subunit